MMREKIKKLATSAVRASMNPLMPADVRDTLLMLVDVLHDIATQNESLTAKVEQLEKERNEQRPR